MFISDVDTTQERCAGSRKEAELTGTSMESKRVQKWRKSGGGRGLTEDYRGEQTRLKPLEANSRERDSSGCWKCQSQGKRDLTLLLIEPWGPPQILASALPQLPYLGGKWSLEPSAPGSCLLLALAVSTSSSSTEVCSSVGFVMWQRSS